MASYGVSRETHVIAYDASDFGVFSSARLWWLCRCFGHANVSVMNGGLQKWANEGRALEGVDDVAHAPAPSAGGECVQTPSRMTPMLVRTALCPARCRPPSPGTPRGRHTHTHGTARCLMARAQLNLQGGLFQVPWTRP